MAGKQHFLTDSQNLFSFKCPIFEVTTKISHCLKLRYLFWRGERPDVRKGCQACMRSGKCPAAVILQKKYPDGRSWQDEYASAVPVEGRIRKDVLERIHRIIVMERTLNDFGVPDAERAKIETASDRIGKMIGAAPLSDSHISGYASQEDTGGPVKRRRSSATSTTIKNAAASGDLAAAVNA